ncbi:SHOCT domain-containing protein [Senimuribacter intestinalis]|uniref:SHOCT domain-containing protein n=1 Tax=Senimuribacter intestinalis TaxID=2941507 RepID=UPI00203FD591|nr:SHOCT domain-containing protein [Senimuribacter intestinalis]
MEFTQREIEKIMPYIREMHEKEMRKEKLIVSSADEIRKFKELWDDGIITAEEFQQKKKTLLDL